MLVEAAHRGWGEGGLALEEKGAFLPDSDALLFSATLGSWSVNNLPQHPHCGFRESSEIRDV